MGSNGKITAAIFGSLLVCLLTALAGACGQPAPTPTPIAPTHTLAPTSALASNFTEETSAVPPSSPEPVIIPTPRPKPTATANPPNASVALPPGAMLSSSASEIFPSAPERDLFQLTAELGPLADFTGMARVVNPEPVSYSEGRIDDFWVVDLDTLERYRPSFELRLVSSNAYWYVEEGRRVAQADLERAAAEFEARIYPIVTEYFGQEWKPGVDNDPHLTILHGDIRGAAGYFSGNDEYPVSVRPYSNQREMIYLNSDYLRVGSAPYLAVLAHELQHAIQWNNDHSEDTWVNEGLAELAASIAGYPPRSIDRFMRYGSYSLVHWPLDHVGISSHYGGAALFMRYLAEHYPDGNHKDGKGSLRQLLIEPKDNIAGINAYLAAMGYDKTFDTVFRDWTVANFLDEPQGIYGYSELQVLMRESSLINTFGAVEQQVDQYGTHYIELGPELKKRPLRIRFEGAVTNKLLPAPEFEAGCWWSNSGDSITTALTRSVDLSGLTQATLDYQVWYSIEEEWDYVYLQVSRDGGKRWDVLETAHTSSANPIGVAFGPGYTGKSDGWLTESIDLSEYADQKIQVRFQYVTDDALNDIGLCVREIAIPEAGVYAGDEDWQGDGFFWTDNRTPQDYIVQIIQKGAANRVISLPLTPVSSQGGGAEVGGLAGEVIIQPYPELKRAVVAVSAIAPKTRQKAPYKLSVETVEP